MKPHTFLLAAALAVAAAEAAPPTPIQILMTLSDARSYAWHSDVTDDKGGYDVNGKTTDEGYTWVRMPTIESLAKRLGREAEPDVEAIFRGATAYVVRTEDGWRAPAELPAVHPEWREPEELTYLVVSRRHAAMGGRVDLDPSESRPYVFVVPVVRESKTTPRDVQFAPSVPHEELAVIVSTHRSIHAGRSHMEGTLGTRGVRLLLIRDNQPTLQVQRGAGTFKVWLRGTALVKYRLDLEGEVLIEGKHVHVDQHSVTTIQAVNATTVEVPADVRLKLRG